MGDEDTALTPIDMTLPQVSLCQRCGTLVLDGWQGAHVDWHHQNDVTLSPSC